MGGFRMAKDQRFDDRSLPAPRSIAIGTATEWRVRRHVWSSDFLPFGFGSTEQVSALSLLERGKTVRPGLGDAPLSDHRAVTPGPKSTTGSVQCFRGSADSVEPSYSPRLRGLSPVASAA